MSYTHIQMKQWMKEEMVSKGFKKEGWTNDKWHGFCRNKANILFNEEFDLFIDPGPVETPEQVIMEYKQEQLSAKTAKVPKNPRPTLYKRVGFKPNVELPPITEDPAELRRREKMAGVPVVWVSEVLETHVVRSILLRVVFAAMLAVVLVIWGQREALYTGVSSRAKTLYTGVSSRAKTLYADRLSRSHYSCKTLDPEVFYCALPTLPRDAKKDESFISCRARIRLERRFIAPLPYPDNCSPKNYNNGGVQRMQACLRENTVVYHYDPFGWC
jgi:hypothetical protein